MPGVVSRRSCVLTCFPEDGAAHTWLHHTRMAVRSPPRRRVQSRGGERSATEKFLCSLLPSSAKSGLHASTLSRERQARVRSSPRKPLATRAGEHRSARGCPSTAQGAGHRALEAPGRSRTPGMPPAGASLGGAAPRCPVRPQAPPLSSLTAGSMSSSRKPPGVGAWKRRHGPTAGPGGSRLCLCRVFSPSERGISGPPDGL
jgi:hypothetical protein